MKPRLFAIAAFLAIASSASAYDTPTMGWSSWNTYRVNISDSLICVQANAMAANGMAEAGYRYINIDDGYFGGRGADGTLLTHPLRFPHGLKPVVDHIHSLGFKAGIYSDAGRNTCGNFWDNDTIARGVGLYGHDEQDARFFFDDMGFDFIKVDFCGGDASQNSDSLDLDERERYTAIRHAIDAVGRPDVRVNICRWAFPGTWVSSVGSSWRVSPDIQPRWSSVKSIIARNTFLSAYAGEGSYNDMDMLEIGRGLSPAEERTHFGMWCMMSSPLLVGCDLTSIPAASLELITNPEIVAVNQDTLGLQASRVKVDNGIEVFVKDVERLHGPTRAVAFYNPSDTAATVALALSEVGLGGNAKVRDLFVREWLPMVTDDTLHVAVGPHDTAIFCLEASTRTEPRLYEAETAWLERYQELGHTADTGYARYEADAECSGGGKVTWLGAHPDNYMEWRDVWTISGGDYILSADFEGEGADTVSVSVNGGVAVSLPTAPGGTVKIRLEPGSNRVRLSSPAAFAPAIDCIRIDRL